MSGPEPAPTPPVGSPPGSGRPFARGRSATAGEGHEPDLVLERLLFFSDAVFAIAMTLLVVDLHPPELAVSAPEASIASALTADLGQVLAFVISFVVVGLYWEGHVRIFGAVRATDRRLIGLNLAFLIWIAFMPYPTAILGGHEPTRLTVAFYAAVQVGAGLFEAAIWVYATRHPAIVRPSVDPDLARLVTAHILRGPVVFAASIVIALVSPWLGIASWALMIPAALVIDRRWGRTTGG
jgi:TMEM175 potassium channel family protein